MNDSLRPMDRLLGIMARLRDPDSGCPWDRAQTFATIAPYTIEESYEVSQAIADDDLGALRDELGDLLFQIVFHAQMAREIGAFDFDQIAGSVSDKMVRRHPHVFGDDATIKNADLQTRSWESMKAEERAAKASDEKREQGVLDGIALALPALARAQKIQKRAARVGFDWPDLAPVLEKLDEEIAEVKAEIKAGASHARLADEIGDVLFATVNLARHFNIDAEEALRDGNAKFERRFRAIERHLAESGRTPDDTDLDELERLWQQAKKEEAIGS